MPPPTDDTGRPSRSPPLQLSFSLLSIQFDVRPYAENGTVFRSDDTEEATVRYDPSIARWIRERAEGTDEPNGGYVRGTGWRIRIGLCGMCWSMEGRLRWWGRPRCAPLWWRGWGGWHEGRRLTGL